MFLHPARAMILLLLIFGLVACNTADDNMPTLASDDANPPAQAENADENPPANEDNNPPETGNTVDRDLASGEYTLSVTGPVTPGETYTHERRSGVEYDPYGSGSNAEGPYGITLRLDGTYEDTPVHIEVQLVIRGDLTPGTYTLQNSMSNNQEARAFVEVTEVSDEIFANEIFDFRNPNGTITIDHMDSDFSSGATTFTATTDDGDEVSIDAAWFEVPFDPDLETNFTYGGRFEGETMNSTSRRESIGETPTHEITFASSGDGFIMMSILADIEPGTYDVAAEDSPITFVVGSNASGTVTLTSTDVYYAGELDLTFADEDDGDGTISGTFEYIPVPGGPAD